MRATRFLASTFYSKSTAQKVINTLHNSRCRNNTYATVYVCTAKNVGQNNA